jgi:hypothetical protein
LNIKSSYLFFQKDVLDTLVLEESVKAAENEHLSEDDDQGMEEIDPDAPFTFGQGITIHSLRWVIA